MPENTCSLCHQFQYSIFDKKYLQQNGHCWKCDREKWKDNDLTTDEFELRERLANQEVEKEE
jgi:hypothetical protein